MWKTESSTLGSPQIERPEVLSKAEDRNRYRNISEQKEQGRYPTATVPIRHQNIFRLLSAVRRNKAGPREPHTLIKTLSALVIFYPSPSGMRFYVTFNAMLRLSYRRYILVTAITPRPSGQGYTHLQMTVKVIVVTLALSLFLS